ncbi:GNAT family N-acetyltransferase [Clostridium sp. FP2]|uniref:GNAT family N-acetyltransferase n=1 Tax=Clostridium sp. FP2 TaxID=2724481 RepID=UPI0013E99D88|nr:GNAT family protein [Clostridium sp. FP2]MBZ9623763.1 GNAT family N-acetyltransferase [Clostridium sp. FP2]
MGIFENHIIRLREATLEDAEELLRVTNDEDVMKYYGIEPYINIKEAEEEINWFISLFKGNNGARWVIADKKTNKYIGDIGVFDLDRQHNKIEIGFKLKKEYWNKGIMTDCISELLKFSFSNKNYNRVQAKVDPRNIGCKKTLEKCGFKLEGLLREYEFEHGDYVDLQVYSILKREYSK